MAKILALFILLASLFLPFSPRAAETFDRTAFLPPEQIQIAQLIDPLRLRLRTGDIIQLAGIEMPDLDPHEAGEHALAAFAALKPMLEGKQARLYLTKDSRRGRTNRMGYRLGHVETGGDDPVWLQGYLIAAGYARARPDSANPEMAAEMGALEDAARTAKKGLWADPYYAVQTPETAETLIGRFGIVEGRIHAVAMNNNMTFLNFGPDWRTDFTIGMEPETRRAFTRRNMDPQKWQGRTVRVRGWVEKYNGPFIRLEDISRLEFITAPEGQPDHDE